MTYFIILFLFLMKFTLQVFSIPSVTLSSGKFNGEILSSYNGVSYMSFKGIKFATVTERFKEATPIEDSNESFNATDFGPLCNQMNGNKSVGVEDCLYLNVFTPKLDGSVPVMVYIYGGAFNVGSSNNYSPDYFMASRKVVIVSISYRVNAFGFLYFDDPNYPANLGIRDQILALEWIKKNVENFGGDPNRVTIVGQSAGAASVSILMNSLATKGLFVGAISESGTACALWAIQPRCTGIQRLKMLSEKLNCDAYLPKQGGSADKIVKCLKSKSAKEILEKIQDFEIYEKFVPFPPIKEPDSVKNPVITTYPWLSDKQNEKLVPWITGVNSNEARTFVAGALPTSKLATVGLIAATPFFLPELFLYTNTASEPLKVTSRIILKNAKLYAVNYNAFLEKIINEGDFFYPMTKCLNRNTAPSYGYYFNYLSSKEQGKLIGVDHSGELKYLWPPHSSFEIRLNGSQSDKEISNFLVNTWIDFAYHQSLSSPQKWDIYDSKLDNVLIIDNNGIKMGKNPNQNVIDFWHSLNLSSQPIDKSCSLMSYITHFFNIF